MIYMYCEIQKGGHPYVFNRFEGAKFGEWSNVYDAVRGQLLSAMLRIRDVILSFCQQVIYF
jgi:hypothetical protein